MTTKQDGMHKYLNFMEVPAHQGKLVAKMGMNEMTQRFLLTVAVGFLFLPQSVYAEENASNPLAAVNNVDLKWQYTSNSGKYAHDLHIEGAHMVLPQLKLKYELHYNLTNATGRDEQDFEKVIIKPILFPYERLINSTWDMRLAVGGDLIIEFGNENKGIGVGANQIAPLFGVAFANKMNGLTLIPLVQHFISVSGPADVNQTSFRLIALQSFAETYWAKLDAKIPYDWENERWPISTELQVGKNINSNLALYADGLVGIGGHRPYDAGLGLGLRFKY